MPFILHHAADRVILIKLDRRDGLQLGNGR